MVSLSTMIQSFDYLFMMRTWVRTTLALKRFLPFLLRRAYKTAKVIITRVGGLPYLRARVNLAGGLTFFLVNTPERDKPPTRGVGTIFDSSCMGKFKYSTPRDAMFT